MKKEFKQQTVSQPREEYMTELDVRELIAAVLANYEGIVRFRNIETTVVSISDFSDSQHNHSNTVGGGQLTDAALSAPVTVPKGGTGVNTLTGIVKGNGAGIMTAIVPLAGSGTFYVAASSGGSPTVKIDYTDGIITNRT